MSHSAKVLCAMCQKKHVGCIHHPLEKKGGQILRRVHQDEQPSLHHHLFGRAKVHQKDIRREVR